MEAKFHPLVELMLARMESHPEEFKAKFEWAVGRLGRWDLVLTQMQEHTTEEEKVAVASKLRIICMDAIHRYAMDELLNGDERRRKEEEDRARYRAGTQSATMSGQLVSLNNYTTAATSADNAYSQSLLDQAKAMLKGMKK